MDVFSRLVPTRSTLADARLRLTWARRQKTRQRVALESGEEGALLLPRGTALRDGQLIASDAGRVVEIVAESEPVSTLRSDDPACLARAAYHLGNRHTPVQVGEGWLRYQADHVLDAMIRGLGIEPQREKAPFEPEPGAYAHRHSHDYGEGRARE